MFGQAIKIAIASLGVTTVIFVGTVFASTTTESQETTIIQPTTEYGPGVKQEIEPLVIETAEEVSSETISFTQTVATEKEIDLLARIAMAEAEGESEFGKRLVIDTVLNRVDSKNFKNTIQGVIYERNQFSPIADGRFDLCYVKSDIRALVIEELESRTNSEVAYFRTVKYSKYGTPLFKEGAHYFSKE